MKFTFTALAVGILLLLSSAVANQTSDEMVAGLQRGDAAQLARQFDHTVELVFPDTRNSYNRTQAEAMLRDFFSLHPVQHFKILHKGEQAGATYYIGFLKTRNGAYRTTTYLKQRADRKWIQEMRFEQQ